MTRGTDVRVYLDTCMWIYAVEDSDGKGRTLLDFWLERLDTADVYFSHLTRMECLVEPIRLGNAGLINEYEELWTLGERLEIRKADVEASCRTRDQDS